MEINGNFKSFDEVLRAYIDKKSESDNKEHDNDWWYASELGFCQRKQFFRRLGLPVSDPKEYRLKFVAHEGKMSHQWREDAAKEMGVVVESEGSLIDPILKVRGRFDLLIKLTDHLSLVDIKTQRSEAFFRRAKKPEGEQVERFQKMQLACYVLILKKKYPELNEARLYYYDRGGGVREEFVFTFSPEMFQEVESELNTMNTLWNQQVFPKIKEVPKWQCKYCPWAKICLKVEKSNLDFNQVKNLYGKKNLNSEN